MIDDLKKIPFVDLGPVPAGTVPSSAPNAQAPVVTAKQARFIDQNGDDCHMSGVLTLYSNGLARWQATTWADKVASEIAIWCETLEILNSADKELAVFGIWDSPPMKAPPDGGGYPWENTCTFPATFFQSAVATTSKATIKNRL